MRFLDLVILVLLTLAVALGILTYAQVKQSSEVKCLTSEKIVETPIVTTKPATVSGKLK
jgi:hypothetical protein